MTKAEMVKRIADDNKLSIRQAEDILDNYVKLFKTELKDSGEVRINGIGTWKIKDKAQRNCINPRNGEKLIAPAGKRVAFKASKTLIS